VVLTPVLESAFNVLFYMPITVPDKRYLLYRLDLNTEKITHLGKHDDSVSSMAWGKELSTPLPSLSFPAFVGLTRCGRWLGDWLMGPHDSLLGPPFLQRNLRNRQTLHTRTHLLDGHCEQHARRRHGQSLVPHLRRAKHGQAHARAGEQLEVHDQELGLYVGWTRYVFRLLVAL
jgi:hypothetical protein